MLNNDDFLFKNNCYELSTSRTKQLIILKKNLHYVSWFLTRDVHWSLGCIFLYTTCTLSDSIFRRLSLPLVSDHEPQYPVLVRGLPSSPHPGHKWVHHHHVSLLSMKSLNNWSYFDNLSVSLLIIKSLNNWSYWDKLNVSLLSMKSLNNWSYLDYLKL